MVYTGNVPLHRKFGAPLIVLKKIEVSQAYPLSAMGFIFTSTFAFFFLHETVSTAKIIGLMLIVVGIIFISRS